LNDLNVFDSTDLPRCTVIVAALPAKRAFPNSDTSTAGDLQDFAAQRGRGKRAVRQKPEAATDWQLVAEELAQLEPEFIYNPAFADPTADDLIMASPADGPDSESSWKPGSAMPAHLARLCERKLLTPGEEHDLFRRMNYSKDRIAALRQHLNPRKPDTALVAQLDRYARIAQADRNRIVQANLRLVVSIAKKFADPKNSFDELLSEGIATLMRAVEKFDYDRGFRFSTYATLAIRRTLSRTITQAQRDRTRFVPTETSRLEETSSENSAEGWNEQRWEDLRSTLTRLLHKLDPRERVIIRSRFGLDRTRQIRTLQSLARDFGVCKERVRQLETRAMSKLRAMAEQTRLEAGDAGMR